MREDLLGTRCMCGIGTFTRGALALVHRDPPGILRCTHCRVPTQRFWNPKLEAMKAKKKLGGGHHG